MTIIPTQIKRNPARLQSLSGGIFYFCSNLAQSFSSALFSIREMYEHEILTFDVIVHIFSRFDNLYGISNNIVEETSFFRTTRKISSFNMPKNQNTDFEKKPERVNARA